ncbi:panthothenate synthetase [Thalassobellus suaedae]|uniref:Panthothenate synthetase n=1 Tax=Thalassobellus suaedae TaxID=3074124 RepID=A0ABY9Y6Y6_9FLAO|nr:panthothenate synthetase [Flavobacteriaceae bacterium HL-DH10]
MRMLVNVTCPIEPFNTMVRNGTAGEIIGRVIDDIKPESIYFTEQDGKRGAVMVVDVPDASDIPSIAEPWFLNFEAICEFRIAMTPDDLMKSNLSKLAEKWNEVQMN